MNDDIHEDEVTTCCRIVDEGMPREEEDSHVVIPKDDLVG